ncbi:MAG: hypothetical protein NHG36_00015 [Chromatiaceae bacterium]|nr:hypothetical protein [Candidatus Thioaporhodococcus sediminis]
MPKIKRTWFQRLAEVVLGVDKPVQSPTPEQYRALLNFNAEHGVKPDNQAELEKAIAASGLSSDADRIIAGLQLKKYRGIYPGRRR